MEKITIHFNLNGKDVCRETDPNKRLIDFLRDDMGMLSVKEGCSEGECGACTVIFNGETVTSCLMLAGQVEGGEVITLEGVADEGDRPNYIQQAFIDVGAVQCGFCTPGMILSAKALLDKNPAPSREEIQTAISGNLCRCTGYTKIIDAIEIARDARGGAKA